MSKILSNGSSGHGGQALSSCLDEMLLLTSKLKQVIHIKVVGNYLIFPPTKFEVLLPTRTPAIGKFLSSV